MTDKLDDMNVGNIDDTISRQTAIKALERKKDKNAKGDIGGFYNKIIQNDIDTLMQLPSAQRWIPVTERLPEEEKDVLITLDGGLVSVGYYMYCSWTEESKVEWFSDDFMVDVVAWMPLPEPWEGADEP